MTTYNIVNKAIWNVSRIQGNEKLPIVPPTSTIYPFTNPSTPVYIDTTTEDLTTEDTTQTIDYEMIEDNF